MRKLYLINICIMHYLVMITSILCNNNKKHKIYRLNTYTTIIQLCLHGHVLRHPLFVRFA